MRDYYMVVLEDCVGAANQELHRATLKNVNLHFGRVTDSNQVKKLWKGNIDG